MIGNAKGWTLAALIVAVEAIVVTYALSLDRVSPPTAVTTTPGALDPITPGIDPRTVVKLDRPGDAGPLYRGAVEAYLADPSPYERFIRDRDRGLLPSLTAIDKLLAATHLSGGAIYADRPEQIIVYGESTTVVALQRLGRAAIDAGLLFERREPVRARTYYEAAFSLGVRLFEERLTYREMEAGVTLMSTAGASLAAQAKKAGRADELATITRFTDAQRDVFTTKWQPTVEAIYTMNESRISAHAGDVFAFATDGRERMWRVEAILKLGRMRFNVGNPGRAGDQRHAERLVRLMAERETDPAIRRAATLARDLTVEGFRVLR